MARPWPESSCGVEQIDAETYQIDVGYGGERGITAAYLLLDTHPTLIETGASPGLELLEAGVEQAGLTMHDIHYVAVTHIHLDHAGAAGVLVNRYPHLTLYVHPVGAPHLADPSRLLRSARRVFGDRFDFLFGQVLPVPEDRIRPLTHGETLSLGRRTLQAVDTPGHASHHLAYFERERRWVYTGDVAGIRLRGSRGIVPPTPPPDIDVELWVESLQRLRSLQPRRLLFTHFSWTDDWERALDEVERGLRDRAEFVRRSLADGLPLAEITREFDERFEAPLRRGVPTALARHHQLTADSAANAQGLVRYWTKKGCPPPS